jgi:hypothetical protein
MDRGGKIKFVAAIQMMLRKILYSSVYTQSLSHYDLSTLFFIINLISLNMNPLTSGK